MKNWAIYIAVAIGVVAYNAATDADRDSTGAIVSYEWDFDGDGTFDDTGVMVNHTYQTPGTYNAKLRVTDSVGQTDEKVEAIVVE